MADEEIEWLKFTPLTILCLLLFAAVVGLGVLQISPWASKSDVKASFELRDQTMAEIRKRLDDDDMKFTSINAKLDSINSNNGDIRETLGQIRQRLDDMQDPNVPYIPKNKHK